MVQIAPADKWDVLEPELRKMVADDVAIGLPLADCLLAHMLQASITGKLSKLPKGEIDADTARGVRIILSVYGLDD